MKLCNNTSNNLLLWKRNDQVKLVINTPSHLIDMKKKLLYYTKFSHATVIDVGGARHLYKF